MRTKHFECLAVALQVAEPIQASARLGWYGWKPGKRGDVPGSLQNSPRKTSRAALSGTSIRYNAWMVYRKHAQMGNTADRGNIETSF